MISFVTATIIALLSVFGGCLHAWRGSWLEKNAKGERRFILGFGGIQWKRLTFSLFTTWWMILWNLQPYIDSGWGNAIRALLFFIFWLIGCSFGYGAYHDLFNPYIPGKTSEGWGKWILGNGDPSWPQQKTTKHKFFAGLIRGAIWSIPCAIVSGNPVLALAGLAMPFLWPLNHYSKKGWPVTDMVFGSLLWLSIAVPALLG